MNFSGYSLLFATAILLDYLRILLRYFKLDLDVQHISKTFPDSCASSFKIRILL